MKRISIILSLFIVLTIQFSCTKPVITVEFKDILPYTIYDYLVANKEDYSSFLEILKVGGIDKTLSVYNPNGNKYTLFVPDNKAVDNFIKENGQYTSLANLLEDKAFVKALARYHVLNMSARSDQFPFGAFTQPNLSGDYLNVNFILGEDTTYYKINNLAPVTKANIKVSNGFIHVIGVMLNPITLNSYEWLKKNPEYSILTSALEATGMDKILNVDMKLKDQQLQPFTMLVEPDSIYKKENINSFSDLANIISPSRTDYTSITNPLNLFVGYHILTERKFLSDIIAVKAVTNYNTFADVPLSINGSGIDIMINKGKESFDPKIVNGDTTIIDYVGVYYDESNVNTQSGAIHFIDQILKPQTPSQQDVTFAFEKEPVLMKLYEKGGTYEIDNKDALKYIKWTGAKLFYVKSTDPSEQAYDNDYLFINGFFTISYIIPKIVQGKYTVYLRANALSPLNALVDFYVDGNKLGGLIDLTKGGSTSDPYAQITVGTIDFKKYESHTIEIKSLIPGMFKWDNIQFTIPE